MRSLILPFAASLLLLSNCSDKTEPSAVASLGCDTLDVIDGQCVGATSETLCPNGACTTGTTCDSFQNVTDQTSLSAALSSAAPGSCVALAPGSYESATLPPGVKLLGPGYKKATVKLISIDGAVPAGPAVVRGLTAHQVNVFGPTEIEQSLLTEGALLVDGTTTVAVAVGPAGTLKMSDSTIEKSKGYGLLATDPANVTLTRLAIRENVNAGVWIQCTDGCACVNPVNASIDSTVIRGNAQYGLTLIGVKGSVSSVVVRDTGTGKDFPGGSKAEGGGVITSACSDITATKLHILKNASLGLLVANSKASVGDPNDTGEDRGIIIQGNNSYGVWIQGIDEALGQSVTLRGAMLDDNKYVGVGLSGASRGIIIQGTVIKNTRGGVLPTNLNKADKVGDGLCWRDGAQASLDNLTFSGNTRSNLLLNESAGSGSSTKGIIIQGSPGTEGSIIIQGVPDAAGIPAGLADLSPTELAAGTLDVAPPLTNVALK